MSPLALGLTLLFIVYDWPVELRFSRDDDGIRIAGVDDAGLVVVDAVLDFGQRYSHRQNRGGPYNVVELSLFGHVTGVGYDPIQDVSVIEFASEDEWREARSRLESLGVSLYLLH